MKKHKKIINAKKIKNDIIKIKKGKEIKTMKNTYVLIGSMIAHERMGRLVEKFMTRKTEMAFNQKEMEEKYGNLGYDD